MLCCSSLALLAQTKTNVAEGRREAALYLVLSVDWSWPSIRFTMPGEAQRFSLPETLSLVEMSEVRGDALYCLRLRVEDRYRLLMHSSRSLSAFQSRASNVDQKSIKT
jgi:hypothetical protein